MGTAKKKKPLCPSSTYALLIGNDAKQEWQQNRREIGDIEFHRALSTYAGIPKYQIVSLRDGKATKSKAESLLKKICKVASDGDTLLFYYGGHGKESLFCTEQQPWYHTEVLSIIEKSFRGSYALIVADCCYSGSFRRALQSIKNDNRVSYVCVMSTLPNTEAMSDWVITDCLIRALKGDFLMDLRGDGVISLDELISFLADEVAKTHRDRITCYCLAGKQHFPIDTPFLDSRVSSMRKDKRPQMLTFLPAQPAGWTGIPPCYPGEDVYFKQQEPPIWASATVVSSPSKSENVCLDVGGYHKTVPRQCLLRSTHFFKYNVPFLFLETLCQLAEQGVYICTSIPVGKKIRAVWVDGRQLPGTVISLKKFPWKKFSAKDLLVYRDVGAHVAILWNDEKFCSLVPLKKVVTESKWHSEKFRSLVPIPKVITESTPKKRKHAIAPTVTPTKVLPCTLLRRSLAMNGKRLVRAKDVFHSKGLKCFFPLDGFWYTAKPMQLDKVSCHALASHYCYEEEGDYVAVKWEPGGWDHIMPVRFVMPQLETCVDVQVFIAHHYRYIYYSIPPKTVVSVLWIDNIRYKAMIVSQKEFPWDEIGQADVLNYPELGPYVLIRWDEGEMYSIVPLLNCIPNISRREICPRTPTDALLQSLASAKKFIRKTCPNQKLLGYCSDSDKWMEASTISEENVALSTLASHVNHEDVGQYIAIRWHASGLEALLPERWIKPADPQ